MVAEQHESKDVVRYFALFLSVVFHPSFLPLYGLLLMFNVPDLLVFLPSAVKRVLFSMLLVNTVILPFAILPLLRVRNIIGSYSLRERKDRVVPMLITTIMYFLTAVLVFRLRFPGMIKAFVFASACVVFAVSVLSLRWKISIHSAGAGAMTATVFMLILKAYTGLIWIAVAAILVSGAVMTARLYLSAHNPGQVYGGYITGVTVMTLGLLV